MEMQTISRGRTPKIRVRKLIRTRKRATAMHVQVGVHNPEGTPRIKVRRLIGVVDAGDKKCPRVDVNGGLAVATDQFVCFYTALSWVASPTERVGYVVEIPTGERRTLTLAPSICSTNCSHRNKDK
jgi:hypothetical protein